MPFLLFEPGAGQFAAYVACAFLQISDAKTHRPPSGSERLEATSKVRIKSDGEVECEMSVADACKMVKGCGLKVADSTWARR